VRTNPFKGHLAVQGGECRGLTLLARARTVDAGMNHEVADAERAEPAAQPERAPAIPVAPALRLDDAGGQPQMRSAAAVLALQRSAGNQAVASAVAAPGRRQLLRCAGGECTCGGKCGAGKGEQHEQDAAVSADLAATVQRRHDEASALPTVGAASLAREPGEVEEQRGRRIRVGAGHSDPMGALERGIADLVGARAEPTATEGEVIGSDELIEQLGGEAEYPTDVVGPLPPGGTYAVPHDFVGPPAPGVARSQAFHPTMTVVTAGRATDDCGGYTYKVKWGIPASETASSGWIIQRVDKHFEAQDCTGSPVTPKPADDPSGYPFWEAWEFTAGQNVWVGPASGGAAHSGDTFGAPGYGSGTKGKKTITGEVKAIVGFVLPGGMVPRNAAPAWALPYTRSQPPQFASTLPGAAHTLTAEWDCCPAGTVTKRTTVTTNP
jgi:hypothetical protein